MQRNIEVIIKPILPTCPICSKKTTYKKSGLIYKTIRCTECNTEWEFKLRKGEPQALHLKKANETFVNSMNECWPLLMSEFWENPFEISFWQAFNRIFNERLTAYNRIVRRFRLILENKLESIPALYKGGHKSLLKMSVGELVAEKNAVYFLESLEIIKRKAEKLDEEDCIFALPYERIDIDNVRFDLKKETTFENEEEIRRWISDTWNIFVSSCPLPMIGETTYYEIAIPFEDRGGVLQEPIFMVPVYSNSSMRAEFPHWLISSLFINSVDPVKRIQSFSRVLMSQCVRKEDKFGANVLSRKGTQSKPNV